MTIDKRIIGERNTLAILGYLHRFGWLTSRMIAALVWPTAKQSPAMARRAVRALADDGIVLRRPLPDGGDCYTLSAAGARLLNEAAGLKARSGASLPLGNTVHRACANWYVIHHINEGTTVWTEHEIQSGRAPIVSVDCKVPDALLDMQEGLVWVEVENAWKNRKERATVVQFSSRYLPAGNRLSELAPGQFLQRVAIVGTNVDALRAMCRSFAEALALGDISESQAADVDLVLLPVDKSLVASERVSGSLWYDGLLPALAD
ncbi:hypothetical protein AB3X94_19930 [Paraburkholderia sp. BR10923]|uniref:hypothetical protein n=1 Tax=Paraburkholderia sp. BR10923 TaxID=3236992 RepID=UPI0034CD8AB1